MADVKIIIDKIKMYRDHPIPGQLFADIFPIFGDPKATEAVISNLEHHIRSTYNIEEIANIVCLESRGFFFGPMIALRLGLPCVPVRKSGKLFGKTISASYEKEYAPDLFNMQQGAFEGISGKSNKVILVDDLLATGGSIMAAAKLVEKLGMEMLESVFIFDIPDFYDLNKKNMGEMKWYAMAHLTEENMANELA